MNKIDCGKNFIIEKIKHDSEPVDKTTILDSNIDMIKSVIHDMLLIENNAIEDEYIDLENSVIYYYTEIDKGYYFKITVYWYKKTLIEFSIRVFLYQ